MRRHTALAGAAMIVLAASGCSSWNAKARYMNWHTATQQITATLADQAAAWNRGDLDAFMTPYWKSENLTFSSGDETQRGWQATYDRFKQRYPTREKMGTLEFTDLEVTPLGERRDAALVLGRWRLERTEGPLGGNFSLIFQVIHGEGWRIIHDHTSVTPIPTE